MARTSNRSRLRVDREENSLRNACIRDRNNQPRRSALSSTLGNGRETRGRRETINDGRYSVSSSARSCDRMGPCCCSSRADHRNPPNAGRERLALSFRSSTCGNHSDVDRCRARCVGGPCVRAGRNTVTNAISKSSAPHAGPISVDSSSDVHRCHRVDGGCRSGTSQLDRRSAVGRARGLLPREDAMGRASTCRDLPGLRLLPGGCARPHAVRSPTRVVSGLLIVDLRKSGSAGTERFED